jgi:hypothetical protein
MILAFLPALAPPEILILLLFGLWIWALIDVIRRTDFNGLTRTVWIIGLMLFLFATAVVYLITKLVRKKPVPEIRPFSEN